MKNYYKTIRIAALAIAFTLLFAGESIAQNLINNGTYNATCGGVIRMRALDGQITGTANTGTTDALAVPGVVDWAAAANAQVVQPYYYQRLVVSGGTKTMTTGIFVVGDACPTPLAGYADLAEYPFYVATGTGALDFGTGTFNYTGVTQSIYPTAQPYYILNVTSDATVETGDVVQAYQVTSTGTVDVDGTLTLGGGTSTFDDVVTVAGTLNTATGTGTTAFTGTVGLVDGTLNTYAGNVTFGATTTVDATSEINVLGTGNVGFADLTLNGDLVVNDGGAGGLGTVTLNGAASIGATGTIDLGIGNDLVISSTISNAGDGTNLLFNCGSNITYNGGVQTILPTLNVDGNRYGNLYLSGAGLKTGGTGNGNDINVCGLFDLAGGNLSMLTSNGTFRMVTPSATVNYAGNEEVVGDFARTTDGTLRDYVFNNTQTIIGLELNTDNPTSITLGVRPGTNPNNYSDVTDVNRKVTLTYAGNSDDFEMTARVGYLEDERANWTAPYTQASLRFYEATAAPAAREKVGTGEVYDRTAAGANLGYVELAGIANGTGALPNGIDVFASGNDLVLAAGPTTYYSITDGRWTNPATWDEGTIPTEDDNVEIRTMVYAGIPGPFAGTLAASNTTTEVSVRPTGLVANTIEVANVDGAAFILANEDNVADYVFRTKQESGNTFINSNTNAMLPAFGTGIAADRTTFNAANPGFNGVWIAPWGGNPAILRSFNIQNQGTFNNEGIIEIGN